MTFGSTFGRTFSPTFQPKSQAVAGGGWWLSGGIAAANCVAAYQPKGAASLAASYVNLTGNSDYDIVAGATPPTWDTTSGWISPGASTMNTSIVPTRYYTIAIRYSDKAYPASDDWMYLAYTSSGDIRTGLYFNSGDADFSNCNAGSQSKRIVIVDGYLSGVWIVADRKIYYNGTYKDAISSTVGTQTASLGIPIRTGKIQAFSIYSSEITAEQASALSTAMNAL